MRLAAAGASVRGPAHIQECLPNQDAFAAKGSKGGIFVSVADGLGSRACSHIGSRYAVKFARKIARLHNTAQPAEVMRQIKQNWMDALGSDSRDYDTTCLWADVSANGQARLLQIGDGLALVRSAGIFKVVTPNREGFSNQTETLRQAFADKWICHEAHISQAGDGVLLMTDGISDDLMPDCLEQFFDEVYRHARRLSKRAMRRWLEKELMQWSTPLHGDDKSIAGIFRLE